MPAAFADGAAVRRPTADCNTARRTKVFFSNAVFITIFTMHYLLLYRCLGNNLFHFFTVVNAINVLRTLFNKIAGYVTARLYQLENVILAIRCARYYFIKVTFLESAFRAACR